MTKALLLLAWVPLLSVSTPRLIQNPYPVTISCDAAWELMDIVKNDDVVLGTDRSSMEQLFLSCLQAQLLISRVNASNFVTDHEKIGLILEIEQVTKKGCFIDAKAD